MSTRRQPTEEPKRQAAKLTALAKRANQSHAACQAAIRSALEHARACGEALLAAKEAVGHGEFESWVIKNCEFSVRMARNYMTLARGWQTLLDLSNRQRVADLQLDSLSVREALRLLSAGSPEVKEWQFLDQTCPSCGERLVVTSAFFATCSSCWNCRLYQNPLKNCPARVGRGKGQKGILAAYGGIKPVERAYALVAMLEKLDADTLWWLEDALAKGGVAERSAAERITQLAGHLGRRDQESIGDSTGT